MTKHKVVFLKFSSEEGGDVIALFPEMSEGAGLCNSYQHIGQHGAASLKLINELSPATKKEYTPLLHELRQIGYNV